MSGYPGAGAIQGYVADLSTANKLFVEIVADITECQIHENEQECGSLITFYAKMAERKEEIEKFLTKDIQNEQGTD